MRSGCINASFPMQESLLMDNVPSSDRAFWKSLDAISMFGWCGSALIGGWLVDRTEDQIAYDDIFLYTALIQFIGGCVMYIPLLFILDNFESSSCGSSDSGSDDSKDKLSGSCS